MRLFVALTFKEDFLKEIEKNIKDIKKKFQGKWIPKENWHLTLAFLGNRFNEKEVIDFLKDNFLNLKINSFFTKKIDWAPEGRPRMIWVYFDKMNFDVFDKIFNKFEVNNFVPHINLIRFNPRPRHSLFKIDKKINLSVKPKSLVLFNSILKKPFAEYSKIYEIDFNV
jgi:2'-5' RNA ligase